MYIATTYDRGASWTTVDAHAEGPGAARLHLELPAAATPAATCSTSTP